MKKKSDAMFHDQAQYFLFGLLFYNVFFKNVCNLDHTNNRNENYVSFIEVVDYIPDQIPLGKNVTLICRTNLTNEIQWLFNGENITNTNIYSQIHLEPSSLSSSSLLLTSSDEKLFTSQLHINSMNIEQSGNYSCLTINDSIELEDVKVLNVTLKTKIIKYSQIEKIKIHDHVTLYCLIEGYPIKITEVKWLKENDVHSGKLLKNSMHITIINETMINVTLQLEDVRAKDNGYYVCQATDGSKSSKKEVIENDEDRDEGSKTTDNIVKVKTLLQVLDKPQVQIDTVKALGVNIIYLNWTVNDGNDPDNLRFRIQYMEEETSAWLFYKGPIDGRKTFAILEDKSFKNNTVYVIRMEAENKQGVSMKSNAVRVKTLEKNPEFIPEVKVTGVTVSSITVSWSPLPLDLQDHINYYQLKLWKLSNDGSRGSSTEAIHSTPGDHLYMFRDLSPATTYEFQVAACNEYTHRCGPWSHIVNGTTNDGVAAAPINASLSCTFDNISHTSCIYVSWKPPIHANGKIIYYNVRLEAEARFINEHGKLYYSTWGPKMTSVSEKLLYTRFYNISANTNYTVRISAVTRSKKDGVQVTLQCTMPPTTPDKAKIAQYTWTRIDEQGKWMFKLHLPRISERNGAICCYRIYMIRMEANKGLAELPSPEDLPIVTYSEAHRTSKGGAYVAEMFSSNSYQSEIFLGDNHVLNYTNSPCIQCPGISSQRISRDKYKQRSMTATSSSSTTTTAAAEAATTTTLSTIITIPNLLSSTKISSLTSTSSSIISTSATDSETLYTDKITENFIFSTDLPTLQQSKRSVQEELDYLPPNDGLLDISSNYTGFVEIVVYGHNKGETLTTYSNYFGILNPGPVQIFEEEASTQVLGIVIQILCALILIVLVLLMALCVLHRYTKQVAHAQGIEMITFRNSFRHLCRSLRGRHRLVSLSPSDMSPIAKTDLVNVYAERHRDSDYGFQREFELLPDRFNDRTTRSSEARENVYKNRYPDIKAYDQTRVKLSQIDSIAGSDYINANFVIGYKERKKFICAQGPMDNTVCDFWRMIWEQHLEIILMLTNLEEYSKTKCAKYWPDKTEGEKTFGDITVVHLDEQRCSDYIIRQLRVTRQNNARNKDERFITQYHYLVWKDFMAPEHPHGIIKFIKRMNEAYSLEKGSILVHCSAGVGRTGTLVALDSLLQQLAEENQVAIFNTVCDLRHQRNFLVQSLKQYIFIYRALMEVAQYGDTEIQASELKTVMDKWKQQHESGSSKMEEDFEKIKNAVEDRKSFTVGGGEENHQKNRSDLVIPYDRNRVILTPIPGKEHSTYINASFIEGYDNSESFIITQDPLEQTIADFWRMISEQGISIIVMLSNLGDNVKKCPRYWPEDEMNYDHITVKYIQSESCPYYTRREFVVTNSKSNEKTMVTQFQYHGWPTVEGEVPEVTRGLIELVDQTQSQMQSQILQQMNGGDGHSNHASHINHTTPIVVHCTFGSERSSMFVALSILVQQLRIERRVDIFTVTRKLRSQRQGMISTFAQYEFLHRAIMNYADLHQLCDNHA